MYFLYKAPFSIYPKTLPLKFISGLAPFDVEVAAKNVNLLDVNETIDDSTEMIVHHLNLNTHPKPVLISVFPRENSTLKVMMDFNEEFDSSNHLVQFQVYQFLCQQIQTCVGSTEFMPLTCSGNVS